MADTNDRYALITGTSSGIGYELAKLFAQDGYNIIAVARTEEDLQKVSNEFKQQYGVEAHYQGPFSAKCSIRVV